MSRISKFPVLLLLSAYIWAGCRSGASGSDFKKYLPTKRVNNEIRLSIPSYLDQLQDSSGEINLLLSNHSKDLIRFPIDMGIRLYLYNDQIDDWEEVENSTTYSVSVINMDEESSKKQLEEEGGIPLFPEGSAFGEPSSDVISAKPVLIGRQLPVKVRVLVVGTIFRDNQPTGEKVAAYYDVEIEP